MTLSVDWKLIYELSVFILGIALGFLISIAIYWGPLKQFCNELKALCSLMRRAYKRGDKVRTSSRLFSVCNEYELPAMSGLRDLIVFHDEGVCWYFDGVEWTRSRVILVHQENDSKTLYKCSYTDIS